MDNRKTVSDILSICKQREEDFIHHHKGRKTVHQCFFSYPPISLTLRYQ